MAKCYINMYTPILMCAACVFYFTVIAACILFLQHEYIGLDDHGSSWVQCGYQVLQPKQPRSIHIYYSSFYDFIFVVVVVVVQCKGIE